MGRYSWIAGLVLCAGVSQPCPDAAALGITGLAGTVGVAVWPPSIELIVVNQAGVPAAMLAQAESQATSIFARIDIHLVWTDAKTAGSDPAPGVALRLTTIILSHSKQGHTGDVMGFAIDGGSVAYSFYERVVDFARQRQIRTATVLGHAIAHEIGHLLLPHRPHSLIGVMRSHWDREYELATLKSSSRGLEFTPEEAALIHAKVLDPFAK